MNQVITILDVETTGLEVAECRIVELGMVRFDVDGTETEFHSLVDPGVPIPVEASDIHGITADKLEGAPMFADIADDALAMVAGAVIGGYGVGRFDAMVLESEFLRAGREFDLSAITVVDSYSIFRHMERRTLTDALKFYCDEDLDDAHTAMADVRASVKILAAQLAKYVDDLPNDPREIESLIDPDRRLRVDPEGKLMRDDSGRICIGFGKYEGRPLSKVLNSAAGFAYCEWILSADFNSKVKSVIRQAMK